MSPPAGGQHPFHRLSSPFARFSFRILCVMLALSGLTVGSLLISGYAPVSFEQEPWDKELAAAGAKNGNREVQISDDSRNSGTIRVSFRLTLDSSNSLVRKTTEGKFARDPIVFADKLIGSIDLTNANRDSIALYYSLPVVTPAEAGRSTISIDATTRDQDVTGEYFLNVWFYCLPRPPCTTAVRIAVPTSKQFSLIRPAAEVTRHDASSIDMISRSRLVEVGVVPKDAGPTDPPGAGVELQAWLDTLKPVVRIFSLLGGWMIAYAWLAKRLTLWSYNSSVPQFGRILKLLLINAFAASGILVSSLLDYQVGSLLSRLYLPYWSQLSAGPLLDAYGPSGSRWPTTAGAMMGILAILSWRSSSSSTASKSLHGMRFATQIRYFIICLAFLCIGVGIDNNSFRGEVLALALVIGLVLVVAGAVVLTRLMGPSRGALIDGLCGAAVVVIVATTNVASGDGAFVVGVTLGAVLIFFTFSVISLITKTLATSGVPVRSTPRISLLIILIIALAVLPWQRRDTSRFLIDIFQVTGLYDGLEPLIRISLIVVLLGFLKTLSKRPVPMPRSLAVGAISLLMLRSDILYHEVPVAFFVGAFLVHAVLIIRKDSVATPLTKPMDKRTTDMESFLRQSATARIIHSRQLALRKKIAGGDGLTSDIGQVVDIGGNVQPPSRRARRNFLNWSGIASPWTRGKIGAIAGAVIGVPLSLPLIPAAIANAGELHSPASWGSLLVTLPNFSFPFYGFALGYFLPLIRGTSGLEKAGSLLIVLVTTESCAILVSTSSQSDIAGPLALRLVQLTMLCAALGVGADLLALRQAGKGLESLGDLYKMNRLALWSSGIAVTAATALVTALVGSAAGLLVNNVLPAAPPSVPTQVQQQQ